MSRRVVKPMIHWSGAPTIAGIVRKHHPMQYVLQVEKFSRSGFVNRSCVRPARMHGHQNDSQPARALVAIQLLPRTSPNSQRSKGLKQPWKLVCHGCRFSCGIARLVVRRGSLLVRPVWLSFMPRDISLGPRGPWPGRVLFSCTGIGPSSGRLYARPL